MNDSIAKSLATIRSIESNEVLNEAAVTAPAAAAVGKGLARHIPGLGLAVGAYDAYGRAKQGDWAGAGLSAAAGLAGLIPGAGTAASIGIAGAQALRDKQRTGSYLPSGDEIAAGVAKDAAAKPTATAAAPTAPTPKGTDPKVLALQQQLIAKGAKIKADGIMGPATQTAMKQFPGVAVAEQNKGNDMSESQRIAELRDRLAQIESSQQVDEIGGALSGIKNFGSALKTGWSGAPVATGKLTKGGAPQMVGQDSAKFAKQLATMPAAQRAAYGVAKTAANNKGKIGLATGAGVTAALSGSGANKPTDPVTPPVKPTVKPTVTPTTTPDAPAAAVFSPEDEQNLAFLSAELEKQRGKNSELDALLDLHKELRPETAGKPIPAPE
jgi:peptidoglycan hydrolase-like protein with peptidoglycan-binding domain